MPCRVDYTPEEEAAMRRESEQRRQDELDALKGLRMKLDTTTRLLCDLTRNLHQAAIDQVEGLPEWVKAHAEMDAKRRAKQAAKKEAKQKASAAKLAQEMAEEKRIYEKLKKKYG